METLPWPLGRATLDKALERLRGGDLVAFPTESTYGIGVALSSGAEGLGRLRRAVGSPRVALTALAASEQMAFSLWSSVPPVALVLATSDWPGPLTLVGPAAEDTPDELRGEGSTPDGLVPTVHVRVPADPALRQMLGRLGQPLIHAPAHPTGGAAPLAAADLLLDALAPDLLLEVEACAGNLPATVLSTVETPPRVLLQGAWRPTLLGEESE